MPVAYDDDVRLTSCCAQSRWLPTTLAADESSGGVPVKMVFERHIVYPNGHREIEGVAPKALPAPDADDPIADHSNINKLED